MNGKTPVTEMTFRFTIDYDKYIEGRKETADRIDSMPNGKGVKPISEMDDREVSVATASPSPVLPRS